MSTGGSEAARAPIYCRDRPYQERSADMARHQMRVGIPESMKSQHLRQYAPKCGSPICAPGLGPPYRFLNDALGDDRQLLVLVLAQVCAADPRLQLRFRRCGSS